MSNLTRRGALCACGCFAAATALGFRATGADAKRPDFVFEQVAPGVWRHTSWNTLPNGAYFPSNGMVVIGAKRALMVDTAWTPDQTTLLLGLLSPLVDAKPIDLFITHFHNDRMGGIGVTASRGIVSHGFERTVAEAWTHNVGAIERTLAADAAVFDLGGRKVEAYYPGPGHTVDNAIAYDPASRTLFGGCMIRAAAATDLGNTADAVVAEWAGAVGRVAARYSTAAMVIPGHGAVGGRDLLAHTVKLISAAG